MNLDLVIAVLQSGSKEAISALLADDTTIFWVDWREFEGDIVKYCEAVLLTGRLTYEWIPTGPGGARELYISYGGKRIRAPLQNNMGDRHIALCVLNEALAPDYEIRFCIDSNGSDTLAFLPLPCATWAELEKRHGGAVSRHFYRYAERPNLFTDPLRF